MARPPKEYQAFTSLTDRLLIVSKTELDRREAEYRKQAEKNPRMRGPKPKAELSLPFRPTAQLMSYADALASSAPISS